MAQRLWIIDRAVAYVDNGHVTLQIDKPTRHLPREQAFEVADKIWFANQMRELAMARQHGETKTIPLTDRRRRSSLRLGGGFMITQGKNLVVAKRKQGTRPYQLCECGGVFELIETNREEDPEDVRNDYVASLLKESQEIALVHDDTLYVPQLAPSQPEKLGFQPPGTLDEYNRIIEKELKHEAKETGVPVEADKVKRFWMKVLEYEQAVRLEYAFSPPLSVEVTAEIDTSSLECVGVLSYPTKINVAVVAFFEETLAVLQHKRKQEADQEKRAGLDKKINEVSFELDQFRKNSADIESSFVYWDTELGWDKEKQREVPLHRDVHLIDIKTGRVVVWQKVSNLKERKSYESDLWKELSSIQLGPGGASGRFATEKLEKAIKMHCPLVFLQPLITF